MFHVAGKTKRTLAVLTLALAGCRAPIQAVTPTPEVEPLHFVSTSSTSPLLQALAASYQRENTLTAIIDQSRRGLSVMQVLAGDVDTPTYALTTYLDSAYTLWSAPIGQDGIAVITHPELRLEKLTASQLRAIFSGSVTRWAQLADQSGDIVVVSREETSATRAAFETLVMGKRKITLNARLATSTQSMLDIVSTTRGAIGYVSFGSYRPPAYIVPVAATVNEAGLLPTLQSIYDETYPLRMPLVVVGTQPPVPGDGYYEFILWAQTTGQPIVAEHYSPLPTIQR